MYINQDHYVQCTQQGEKTISSKTSPVNFINTIDLSTSLSNEQKHVSTTLIPATAPMVFSTFGKLSSVRTPSPPTAGPHEKGPAVKSIKAHLIRNETKIINMKDCECGEVKF